MRRFFGQAVSILLILTLAVGCLACADDKYDSRNATLTAAADTDALTLYAADSACVTYTVTVPKQCVKITIQQLAGGTDGAGDPVVLNEKAFTADSAGVAVTEDGASAIWVIPCDFGANGLDGVRVKAQIPMGEKADYLYTDVAIRVDYPAHTADTLTAAYERLVCLNTDAPYWFTIAPEDEALVLSGLAALSGSAGRSVAKDYGFLYPADGAPQIETAAASGDMEGMFVPEGRILVRLYIPNDNFVSCCAGEGLRVSDSARAILSAAAGLQASDVLYPVAALMQEKAQSFLNDMSLDGLNDYDRVTAVYNRVYNEGLMALTPDSVTALPAAERAYYSDTAYGLFSGFGGNSFGYADAFYLMCNMAGVPCVKLPCAAVDGETNYCVNAVQIENGWYVVDACAAAGAPEGDMYARFCLSAQQAAEYYDIDAPGLTLSASADYNLGSMPEETPAEETETP